MLKCSPCLSDRYRSGVRYRPGLVSIVFPNTPMEYTPEIHLEYTHEKRAYPAKDTPIVFCASAIHLQSKVILYIKPSSANE